MLPLQGARFRSLVRQLRSHELCSQKKNMLFKFVHTTSIELQISSNTINPRIYCQILHLKMNLKYQQRESLSRVRQVDEERKKREG